MRTTIELRAARPEQLFAAVDAGADVISLGQEGCLHKAPAQRVVEELVSRAKDAGLGTGLVAPIAWPRSEQQVHDMVGHALAAGVDTVTVNDWGTMLASTERSRLFVGLALTRSQQMNGRAGGDPVLDASVSDSMSSLGLGGVEVDEITSVDDRMHGRVRTVLGPEPTGWSRSCPTLRARAPMQLAGPSCTALCDTPLHLVASSRWRLIDGKREVLPAGVTPAKIVVWGNAVYRAPVGARTLTAHVVLDLRHTHGDPAQAVRDIREALTAAAEPIDVGDHR